MEKGQPTVCLEGLLGTGPGEGHGEEVEVERPWGGGAAGRWGRVHGQERVGTSELGDSREASSSDLEGAALPKVSSGPAPQRLLPCSSCLYHMMPRSHKVTQLIG